MISVIVILLPSTVSDIESPIKFLSFHNKKGAKKPLFLSSSRLT
jgi:hypothetical protein